MQARSRTIRRRLTIVAHPLAIPAHGPIFFETQRAFGEARGLRHCSSRLRLHKEG
jgi:hypothetical protein